MSLLTISLSLLSKMRIKEFSGKGGELRLLSTLSPTAWKTNPLLKVREKKKEWKDRFTRIRECEQVPKFWSGFDLQGIKKIQKRRNRVTIFYLRLDIMIVWYLSSNKNSNQMWLCLIEKKEKNVSDGIIVRSYLKMNCQQIQLTRARLKSSLT